MGRGSSVGIATRYGLDGPGIEFRWGGGDEIFRTRQDLPWGPPTMGTGPFLGAKLPGRGVDHPTLYRAEVKERVGLCLNSTSGPSWPVLGCTFLLLLLHLKKAWTVLFL